MKDWFIRKINDIAIWALARTGYLDTLIEDIGSVFKTKFEEEKPMPEYANRAFELVKEYELIKESGEYKRHQVYAKLIKEFPDVKKSELGLAIEVGCQKT